MNVSLAASLMEEFAVSTGVRNGAVPRRYLWTDAFAVCNFLSLCRETGDARYLDLSVELVRQVHHVLGRHRSDDDRRGWISGLSEQEGELHPTCGGLRIGKRLNERGANEPSDARQEWDQDGQYFHYLTKWIQALQCLTSQTEDGRYLQWAIELAIAAHQGFTVQSASGGPGRMVWKMSIDLSRPLVVSMGHHDPLDGLIRFLLLQVGQGRLGQFSSGHTAGLERAIDDLREMCRGSSWVTSGEGGSSHQWHSSRECSAGSAMRLSNRWAPQ